MGKPNRSRPAIEGGQAVDAVVTITVSQGKDQGELTGMLEIVNGQFVEAVAINPTVPIAIPAPTSQGVTISPVATAAVGN